MASFGMGFVHAMLVDFAGRSDRGSTWDRERRLTDALVETTSRFDDLYEQAPADPAGDPQAPPPTIPPQSGLHAIVVETVALVSRLRPAR